MQDYVLGGSEDAGPGILVRSGHHEADLLKRRMQPCYWPGAQHRLVRGSWFLEKGADWVPLRVRLAASGRRSSCSLLDCGMLLAGHAAPSPVSQPLMDEHAEAGRVQQQLRQEGIQLCTACPGQGNRHCSQGCWCTQEPLADELEEAFRSGVWLPERGRLGTHNGLAGARVDLRTPTSEYKARPCLRLLLGG